MMTDQELLEYVEKKTIEKMLNGCEIDDHLGYKEYNPGDWAVTFRADTISRLIDMAKKKEWQDLTDDEWQELADKYDLIIWSKFRREIEARLKQKNGYAEEKNT